MPSVPSLSVPNRGKKTNCVFSKAKTKASVQSPLEPMQSAVAPGTAKFMWSVLPGERECESTGLVQVTGWVGGRERERERERERMSTAFSPGIILACVWNEPGAFSK